MLNCPVSVSQLRVIILLKHLDHMNATREDEAIARRMEELDKEYIETKEFQKLEKEYSRLFKLIHDTEDKEQRNKAFCQLDRLTVDMMAETAKFYYLAGVHDAMQVYDIS
jgi:hypothetical protein